jgi:hypothetical protein
LGVEAQPVPSAPQQAPFSQPRWQQSLTSAQTQLLSWQLAGRHSPASLHAKFIRGPVQQSAPPVHRLPTVEQAHTPLKHSDPSQHSPSAAHALPSALQAHTPWSHASFSQQSASDVQVYPLSLHVWHTPLAQRSPTQHKRF